jgi:hypothetical protein
LSFGVQVLKIKSCKKSLLYSGLFSLLHTLPYPHTPST